MQPKALGSINYVINRRHTTLIRSQPKVASTAFSDFIRNASSKEKKRVYAKVLEGASERQRKQAEKAREVSGAD